jgi:hypothetical protein
MTQILYGEEHVRRYRETDGEEGYDWREGSKILLLTTTGRKSGKETTTPLIFAMDGDNPVIVASKGGAPEHPGWYKNLVAFASDVLTLEPGDLLLTGTPSGVGWARDPKMSLQPGDVVEVRVEGIGTLRNTCVSET